jgi:hypothetical protein
MPVKSPPFDINLPNPDNEISFNPLQGAIPGSLLRERSKSASF